MSLESKFGRRRTVNMNEDIAQELNRIANSQGKTLYSLMNEIGQAAIEANKHGYFLQDAVKAKQLLERAKKSRMVLVNQDLWYLASSEVARTHKSKWLEQVYENAVWYANVFLNQSASDQEFIESVKAFVTELMWDCGQQVIVENRDDRDSLDVKLVFVPEMPLEHTRTIFKMFEAMFNTHGYIATDSSVRQGILRVTFKKLDVDLSNRPRTAKS